MAWVILVFLVLIVFSYVRLRGEDLSWLDSNVIPRPQGEPSEAHHGVVDGLKAMSSVGNSGGRRARIAAIRNYMDGMSDGKSFTCEIRPVSAGRIHGEWMIPPGVDPRRRLLYIHGGAWIAGSPKSHRMITDKLAQVANAAVFSLDYRLMPENSRLEGIEDCRTAYRWLLENGPDGSADLDFLVVAGDSAGGNLTLSLVAWARDEGMRPVDAAIAFSPATDVTMTAPSLRDNIASDPMLGPAFGKLINVPSPALWWASVFSNRIRPSNPVVSPLRGDLSGLPPVLVQVSEAEMLLDDARRYVSKAQKADSPVVLQSWPYMVHVWQIFTPELPEAEHAFENIGEFLSNIENHSGSLEAA